MNEFRTVRELGKDELEQLKHAYYYQLVESDNDVLGNLDNWLDIPDEVIFNHYDGITFVPNDFHSEDHWSDESGGDNMKHKVTVVVSGGLVQNVYGTTEDIEVTVLDFDTDDNDTYEEIKEQYQKTDNEMIKIW